MDQSQSTASREPGARCLEPTRLLLLLAFARLLLHALTNNAYGFHRDELATLDDAQQIAWGYVAYPPLTPLVARLALELFGPSLVGLRLFSAAAQCLVMVLAGLMAGELGGRRWAQVIAALGVASAPISLLQSALFQYVSFDYLWWVLIAYFCLRLLNSDNPHWWLAIGAVVGLGLLTKYTIAFLLVGLAAGLLITPERRQLASRWLWAGAGLALLIWLPNLLWQVQHGFISLEFLTAIHARDIRLGRSQGFLAEQLFVSSSLFTVPLWITGLWWCLFARTGQRYRLLGWLYVIPLLLFLLAQSRSYYLAPAYPMLIAAGAVIVERRLAVLHAARAYLGRTIIVGMLSVAVVASGALFLPIAPVNSGIWNLTSQIHDNFVEEIGWPELVESVTRIYTTLPADSQAQTGILTANYGEAGAINLYGPAHGLPAAISGVNSYWLRGYAEPPPENLIVLGYRRDELAGLFGTCDLAGQVTNRSGVRNEETTTHPDIFVCHDPTQPWPLFWKALRHFG